MKVIRRILAGLAICCGFVFLLAACSSSNVSKNYADKINDSYNGGKGTALTYDAVKKDLGDECIDITVINNGTRNGILIAVKGLTAANYEERLKNASQDEKFDYITITVVQSNCTYANFGTGTAGDIQASILNGKSR